MSSAIFTGDCLDILDNIPIESVDLAYIDPPFFTQRNHTLQTKDGEKSYSFADCWKDSDEYLDFICERMIKVRDRMKDTSSVFVHCDKSASHKIKLAMDNLFGLDNFQSEIIWYFKRWSNSKRGLLNSHQTILWYSKSKNFKFNKIYSEYAPSTNVDQILQKRTRDSRNKSTYAKDVEGNVVSNGVKKGVPLSDVWEIPFLNPKAKERVGFPTQKPVILLRRILELATEAGDVVLDPFCGSGTTLVAAKLLNREFIGIDISLDATKLAEERISNPVITESDLMTKGSKSYFNHDKAAADHLVGIDYIPVQRNKGIDGLLKAELNALPAFIRVQRSNETSLEAAGRLKKAAASKGKCELIVLLTKLDIYPPSYDLGVHFIPSASFAIEKMFEEQFTSLSKSK
tara:strand:+ start:3547 stop:4749 length:1203 start_codon:yes stop_codon:yes gene_type:complete